MRRPDGDHLLPRWIGTPSSIEAHQAQVIERILRHCGLWSEPPPQPGLLLVLNDRPAQPCLDVDPDFLEQQRWEQLEMSLEA